MSAADPNNANLTTQVDVKATRLVHMKGDSTVWSRGDSPTPRAVSGTGRRVDDEQPSVILWPGMQVEQYELISEIGRGGMGQVFLARDTKLGRRVALKFLNLRDQRLVERFIVEARATAQCHHENIVVIYEAGEAHGLSFMALELLEGQPLSKLIEGTTLSPRRAIELMLSVARALSHAHKMGIIHRDLKPDNIFITKSGNVKVLDFGIAKLFGRSDPSRPVSRADERQLSDLAMTQPGALLGTIPYMSPEQWGTAEVDRRTDIWAVGIIFWIMLTGQHPIETLTPTNLASVATRLDEAMPSIETVLTHIPAELARLVDGCLTKKKHERIASAADLLAALEILLPSPQQREIRGDECPYPGMVAFQESDAGRFYGRTREVSHVVHKLREHALVVIVGPSGVGKSSLVRAGVVPSLRASEEAWEVLITRPGRDPLSGIAALIESLMMDEVAEASQPDRRQLIERLEAEPGYLGMLLRERARQKQGKLLLFVDQLEELYTMVDSLEARRSYAACLMGVADDASSPLRVVVAMRSDFLDRVDDDRAFLERLLSGLFFLSPVDRAGMHASLVDPLEMASYRFENEDVVTDILDVVEGTSGALPLLQFVAARLWDERDRRRRMLTARSYHALGGVEGALAKHADDVLAALPRSQQQLARAVFVRLVTSDGTRALGSLEDIEQLSDAPGEAANLIEYFAMARLLVVQRRQGQEGATVEIVHESLIDRWPALRRWREESAGDSAFMEQLCSAAKQWESRGRPSGLLWRGEAMEEARRFRRRYRGELLVSECAYLDSVVELATRSARHRRAVVMSALLFMSMLVVMAAVALLWIQEQRQNAVSVGKDLREALQINERQRLLLVERSQEAESQRRKAEKQTEKAKKQKQEAEKQKQQADKLRKQAEKQRQEAVASEKRIGAQLQIIESQRQQAVADKLEIRRNAQTIEMQRQEAVKAQEELRRRIEKLNELPEWLP